MDEKKAIIIDAGSAGLTAACELLRTGKNYKVTILEETNSIGGISKTVYLISYFYVCLFFYYLCFVDLSLTIRF